MISSDRPASNQSQDKHINTTENFSFYINFVEIPAVFIHDSEYILHKKASNQTAGSGTFYISFLV